MAHTPWEHDAGTFLIYVDACSNDLFSGRYCRPFGGESGCFSGLTQLLLEIEQDLNTDEGPQSFQELRNFSPLTGVATESLALPLQKGLLASFSVRIMFRRNASWQGSVTWLEGKQTQSFRSVLELLLLMRSAVMARNLKVEPRPLKKMEYAE